MSVPNVGDFIDLMISIPADGHDNSFAYVISEWTKLQGEHPSTILLVKIFCYVIYLVFSTFSNYEFVAI